MAKFYPAPSEGGGSSDFVSDGTNIRAGENSSFDDTLYTQTSLGAYSRTEAADAIALGGNSAALGQGSTSVAYGAYSSGLESIAIGVFSSSLGEKAIAMGQGANVSGADSIAIGKQAQAQGANAIAIGKNAYATENQIVIGSNETNSLTIPGLSLYTSNAQDGEVLTWDAFGGFNGTGGFSWYGPADKEFEVSGGTLDVQPTFNGDPLFTGSYIKTGRQIHFTIDVDFDNITSFGTGQFYLNLPFTSKYNYQFASGCFHDISTGIDYPIFGHVYAGQSQMLLKTLDAQGNTAYNIPFAEGTPVALDAADNFHISGTYIAL
jgi:hypothetical protein